MPDITLVVKTFERPKAITSLIGSFCRFYPNIPAIIVDDSREETRLTLGLHPFENHTNVRYIRTPFDIGVSAGRNLGVSQVKTPYVFICDDDHEFIQETSLDHLKESLEMSGADILACNANDGSEPACFAQNRDGVHLVRGYHGQSRTTAGMVTFYDVVPQRFLARTEILKRCQWDEQMKTGEHWAFFYDHQEEFKVGFLENVRMNHLRDAFNNKFYLTFRDRDPACQKAWNARKGIKNFYNVVGNCAGEAWQ